MPTQPSNQQKNNAGRHLVVAEALLRGLPAKLIASGAYVEVNGHKARVQMATKGAWQVADVTQYTTSSEEWFILVDISGGARDFYVCPGDKQRADVAKRHQEHLDNHDGKRPRNPDSKHAAIKPEHVAKWKNRWKPLS